MKDYLKLLRFLKGHRKLFAIAILTMLVASFFEIFSYSLIIPILDNVFTGKKIAVSHALPAFLDRAVDYVNGFDDRMELFRLITVIFLSITVLKNIFIFAYQYLMSDVSQRIMRDIRSKLYTKIQSLSLDYFSKKRTGELISRITNDVNFVENAVSYGLTDLFRQTFTIIFCVYMAFTLVPQTAFVIFILFPLIGYPLSRIGKTLKKVSKGMQEQLADINTHLMETISGIKLVKAFNTEAYEVKRFEKHNYALYKWWMKSVKRLIVISPFTDIVSTVMGIGLMLWIGPRIISGEISFGVFTLFFASFMNIISPAKKLGNVNALIQKALAASDRIYEVLNQTPTVQESPNARKIGELQNAIILDHVDFQYDQESGIVLKDINLEIKKGRLIAIVGPTGTGKTTLVNLIPRFYDPLAGSVFIDGVNLKDATFQSIRDQIGIVSQETILFNDTVKNNICYGRENSTQAEVEQAAQRAFAHQFIAKMPQGYDTIIGDRGFRLSGGEKQRLSIARAILRNPPILILDEATSQLDSESEKFIQEALDILMQGRTVVAIAHRLSTIKKADKIVVLDQGRMVGQGRHEELLQTCPLYEKLHRMQFQG